MENSELFEDIRIMFLLGGLWTSNSTGWFKFYSHTLHSSFFIMLISVMFETMNAYTTSTQTFGLNLGILCSMTVTSIKIVIIKRSKYHKLLAEIFDNEKYMHSGTKPELKSHYFKGRRTTVKLMKSFKYIMIMAVLAAVFLGFFFMVKYGIMINCDETCDRPTFIPVKLPFNHKKHYIFTNICYILLAPVVGLMSVTVDYAIFCPLIHIIFRLRNLKYVLIHLDNFSESSETNSSDTSLDTIKKCVLEHERIITEIMICNSSLKIIFFFDFLLHSTQIASFAVCLIGSESLLEMENIMTFAAFCFIFVQLLIVYWYGQSLMDEGENISTAAYQSNWYLTDPKSRRYLWTMMMRSQKPLGLSIGPMGSVNLNAFIQIVKTVYSIMTLLLRR